MQITCRVVKCPSVSILYSLFQADKDANKGIDFSEFAKLWEAIHGEGEVHILYENEQQIISYSLQIKRLK